MSIEKLNSNTNTLPLDKRIAILCDRKAIDGKSLAAIIGISPQYLTGIRHEKKLKGIPIKFWRGVQQHFPEWEPFLRGETEKKERSTAMKERFVFAVIGLSFFLASASPKSKS